MSKKTININGTAQQMVDDVNDNFSELYNGQGSDGSSTALKDHTETYSTDTATYTSGKVMTESDGVLVFSDAESSRKIFCLDIDEQDDSVAYVVNGVQAASNNLAVAFVDDENNIIYGTTAGTSAFDKAVLVSLADVSKIYISRGGSETSASVGVVVFEDGGVLNENGVVANCDKRLTAFTKCSISVSENNDFGLVSENSNHTIVCMIQGCKRIEGYGYRASGQAWVVLDKNLKVIKRFNTSAYRYTKTPWQSIPDGARFLAFTDTAGMATYGSESSYTLKTKAKKVEYNILLVGNSYTYNYLNYVPAILGHWLNDDYKVTIFVGMVGMGQFSGWADWLSDGTTRGLSVSYGNGWESFSSETAAGMFSKIDIDLVGFQQFSDLSATYSSWSSLWQGAVDKVSELSGKRIETMWTMVHAKPNGGNLESTDSRMESIFSANQSMAADFPVDICPVGTAIQNARHTSINDLPWVGNEKAGQLTLDGSHLQGGIAPFLAGLVVARFICKKLGIDIPCTGDTLNIDADFDSNYNTLDSYTGESKVYSTGAAMNRVVQRCVEAALRFPYEIKTNLEVTENDDENE